MPPIDIRMDHCRETETGKQGAGLGEVTANVTVYYVVGRYLLWWILSNVATNPHYYHMYGCMVVYYLLCRQINYLYLGVPPIDK